MKMDNKIAIAIILSLGILGYAVVNSYTKFELDNRERASNKERLEYIQECKDSAHVTYSSDWNSVCRLLEKENGCALPEYNVKVMDTRYKEAIDNCYRK